jgi:hypothetical protein
MIRSRHKSTKDAHENRNMSNRKPYRSKALKIEAREKAYKGKDGAWRSQTEVLFHPPVT